MKLEHYTAEPFTLARGRTYMQEPPLGPMKPTGLWVSVAGEDDWPWWCRSESFRVGDLAYRSVITLKRAANIPTITSPGMLDTFHRAYAVEPEYRPIPGWPVDRKLDSRFWGVDWARVAESFQGFIVAPYLWKSRFDGPSWYAGMDCASGCIWDLNAIDTVTCTKVLGEGEAPPMRRDNTPHEKERT